MVARDDTELGELKNRATERGLVMNVSNKTRTVRRWAWPFGQRSD